MKKLIVISAESSFPQECDLIHQLFEAGLSCFHLRKPTADTTALKKILDQIATEFHQHLVLHQHFELAFDFGLGGVHLSEKTSEAFSADAFAGLYQKLKSHGMSISTSVHTIEKLQKLDQRFNYVLYSPVFPSISKPGYLPKQKMDVQDLAISTNIIGLGGIRADNLFLLQERGYQGAALLGYIWEEPEKAISNFEKILQLWPKSALLQ